MKKKIILVLLASLFMLGIQAQEWVPMNESWGIFEVAENVREQMNSGSAPEMEICESISGFENTYYIDNFNLIMKELDKFKSDDDYRNIEKLKAFEQKFIRFLNRETAAAGSLPCGFRRFLCRVSRLFSRLRVSVLSH